MTALALAEKQPHSCLCWPNVHIMCLQGSLGNCWAIAAISTLAQYAADKDDYNQDIAGMFLTKEYQPTKPVDIQLYDWDEATRELTRRVISVPDSFPYNTVDDKPLCASPKGEQPSEAWGLAG